MGHPAQLEAAGRDHLLPISHQDGEGVEGLLQDGIGAVVERRQWRHMAVPADQHKGGSQQLGWQLSSQQVARGLRRC